MLADLAMAMMTWLPDSCHLAISPAVLDSKTNYPEMQATVLVCSPPGCRRDNIWHPGTRCILSVKKAARIPVVRRVRTHGLCNVEVRT